MREALRLAPTAPLRSTSPHEETVIGGGKYILEKDARVLCNIYVIQRDPKVWGEDVRMTSVRVLSLAKYSPRLRNSDLSACLMGSSRPYRYVVPANIQSSLTFCN